MPGGNVDLIAIIGKRGSGKSEIAVPLFLSYASGVYLDMGVASNYFKFKKDNRLGVSIPRAINLQNAIHYLKENKISHFSFKPVSVEEAKEFLKIFSQVGFGKCLFIDDAQKLLSYYDSVDEYKDFLSDGRMQEQNLILCFHKITEVSTKTRSEATKLIYMGPIERPKDVSLLYSEWIPDYSRYDHKPNEDDLLQELLANPLYNPYYLKK